MILKACKGYQKLLCNLSLLYSKIRSTRDERIRAAKTKRDKIINLINQGFAFLPENIYLFSSDYF